MADDLRFGIAGVEQSQLEETVKGAGSGIRHVHLHRNGLVLLHRIGGVGEVGIDVEVCGGHRRVGVGFRTDVGENGVGEIHIPGVGVGRPITIVILPTCVGAGAVRGCHQTKIARSIGDIQSSKEVSADVDRSGEDAFVFGTGVRVVGYFAERYSLASEHRSWGSVVVSPYFEDDAAVGAVHCANRDFDFFDGSIAGMGEVVRFGFVPIDVTACKVAATIGGINGRRARERVVQVGASGGVGGVGRGGTAGDCDRDGVGVACAGAHKRPRALAAGLGKDRHLIGACRNGDRAAVLQRGIHHRADRTAQLSDNLSLHVVGSKQR